MAFPAALESFDAGAGLAVLDLEAAVVDAAAHEGEERARHGVALLHKVVDVERHVEVRRRSLPHRRHAT